MDKGRLLNLARKFKRIYESGEPYIPGHSWTLTQHQEQHKHRVERAQRLLSLEHIPRLTEAELRELFADTDALGFFKVKAKREKVLDERLSGEGTERIRSALLSLFQVAEAELTPAAFLKAQQTPGLGTVLISELLSYRFPSRYYTYSSRVTLRALKKLGEDVKAAQPHGKKGDHYLYFVLKPLMDEICNALRIVGLTEVDYMLADVFFELVVNSNDGLLPRYWKISPGEEAMYWNAFRELSCIAMGWNSAGDLLRFNSQKEIKNFVTQEGIGGKKVSYTSKQLWWLGHEMQAGDRVFAYGSKKILGVGRIVGGYEFRQDNVMHYAHRRPVEWTHLGSRAISNLPEDLQGKLTRNETIVSLSEREGQQVMALYESGISPPPEPEGPQVKPSLSRYFAAYGLHFTPEQLATFYTALKTKGFVILTGISGTGKTKLAQYFAELLGSKDQFHFAAVRPDWRDSKSLLGYFNPLLGQEGQFQSTDFLQFLLQAYDNYWSSLHELKWEADGPYAGTLLAEQPNAFSTDTVRLSLKAVNASGQVVAEGTFEFKVNERRQLALPGQMDDLQPFKNAAKIYALELDRVSPYFVLLDEMNLAKVEYYFADFLSVLESGRDDDGFTKEAIRFQYPKGIDGPPPKLRLPPNLYFIGTVNVDETTYMFSPKVLDRAFTLELSEVDFAAYLSERGDGLSQEELEALRAQLLPDFTNQGRFAIVDKDAVADFVRQYPTHREHLTELNALLQPHDLHFGYRVFDEIMMFLANAEGSPVFGGFGPDRLDAAFDAAVLMKVLPKFHGTRGKLREPLEKIVRWAREPANPEVGRQALAEKLQNTEGIASLKEDLRKRIEGGTIEESSSASAFAYPRTALKALRMLHDLHTTGFASFA
jgi:energy-coupling factor transporter ATP-binding protein EcfA2